MYQNDFVMPKSVYLLNHSVGRPLQSLRQAFDERFFLPWQGSGREPWGDWLSVVEDFRVQLARLFNSETRLFCPQVNLSSGLTKLVQSHSRLRRPGAVTLMSENDFPSMGFALRQALPEAELRFIPANLDVSLAEVWQAHLTDDIDLVFISHAYSNTGQQAPLDYLVPKVRELGALSLVDVAQAAGVLPLDLNALKPDFMLGSSVKWLCGGPGAAYLWVSADQLVHCSPQDVGWFSHENPFEFDIHDFRYHDSALKFWGGTPSVAPFALAAHSIGYFAELGSDKVRQHNLMQLERIWRQVGDALVSPSDPARCSGTAILDFGEAQQTAVEALTQADISLDVRKQGMRISPHIYNGEQDMQRLLDALAPFCR
ncbi:aminotransferase class V-fold PLP-dependent enzyme [Shewanella halotolerans]|uniref:aminotransferase class V-fold PLP-dependent enzyme n=1 Tax=Shewanella halotolerans TaxID=2864204 RepID=UPI001C66151F|nr:aminotransferase class V-fold PLP-dependent enzyme [Shewanella halotolerans]QYJ89755.1 aminotransferase class V-fold PLP-dependent enzyme [Shewanella halotolerans]